MLAKMKSNLMACLVIAACSLEVAELLQQSHRNQRQDHRHKRTLVFTEDSATGILVALAVPLLIPERDIFVSYNFEANYGMPGDASDFTQGVLKRVDNDQIHPEEGEAAEEKRSIGTVAPIAAGFTRKKVFRTIELSLNRHGYDGKKCILRMICELAKHPVHDGNGIVGDLLQLLFTPSGSQDEGLPDEFYQAEKNGKQENCVKYRRYCPNDPLEVISVIM